MTKPYNISSRDYLRRARKRLSSGSLESLFYAAFELRSGIEARMEEYLQTQTHISRNKKRGWQIARLGRNIENAFSGHDKIVELKMIRLDSGDNPFFIYYTPVRKTLQNNGQKLGNYLHSMKINKSPNDKWWRQFKSLLETTSSELATATTGTLLGPPLLSPTDGHIMMHVETLEGEDARAMVKKIGLKGEKVTMQVRYLDKLPIRPGS